MIHGNIFTILSILIFITVILVIFDTTIRKNIFYFQIQSFLVVLFGIIFAIKENEILILIASIIGFFTKVIIVPQALYYLQSRTQTKSDVSKEYMPSFHIGIIIALLIFSYLITKNITSSMTNVESTVLILGLAIFFLGLYKMIIKNNLVAQIVSFVTLENAITLLAIVFAPKLPIIVEIGLVLLIVIAVAIMVTLSLNVKRMFKSFDTNKLSKLKD